MIEIQNLVKRFGSTEVLKDVSITIQDGSIYGLVGVSGAGKSTLLRCIDGLEGFDEGSLVVNGIKVSSLSEKSLRTFRREVGMIFQHFSLLERKTVFENIAFPMKCHGFPKEKIEERIKELLELVGLSEKEASLPRELSGGQKQRVAIARALTMNPRILLCDEATSALDPNITRSILALLKKINKELGITIVVVTHSMSVVKEVCDSVAILEHGVLSYVGGVKELFFNRPDCIEHITGAHAHKEVSADEAAYTLIQRTEDEGLLARIAIGTGINFRVTWGGLDVYQDVVAGSFTVAVPQGQADVFEKYLDEHESAVEWHALEEEVA